MISYFFIKTNATSFASEANPFSDVPSDHWAYDAVSQLAQDGVIEGYKMVAKNPRACPWDKSHLSFS